MSHESELKKLSYKEIALSTPGPKTKKEGLILFFKGFLMGIADLIPGVSGGTIAFVTGIYDSLLKAVASIDKVFFKALLSFNFKLALSKIHLRFILPVFFGIAVSMITLARVMHFLINSHPIPTWGAFFGLILGSIILIFNQLEMKEESLKIEKIIFLIIGAILGYILVSLIPVETPNGSWFIFLCGIIGITAMILPGISGSFLLLILGKYEFITGSLKNPFADGAFITLVTFLAGTATGLLSFSKVLNFLMNRYRLKTMAFLTGILIGSLKKVWPWKEVLDSMVIRGKTKVIREANIFPTSFNGEDILSIVLIVISFFAVIILDRKSRSKSTCSSVG